MLREADLSELIFLVVDDSDFMRRLMVDVLQHLGVGTILQAASSEEAMSQITMVPPDLIICDWQMYPTDGLTFLRQIRSHGRPAVSRIPFLMVTGHASDDYVKAALGEGANSFVVKPYSIEILVTHILRILDEAADQEPADVWNVA